MGSNWLREGAVLSQLVAGIDGTTAMARAARPNRNPHLHPHTHEYQPPYVSASSSHHMDAGDGCGPQPPPPRPSTVDAGVASSASHLRRDRYAAHNASSYAPDEEAYDDHQHDRRTYMYSERDEYSGLARESSLSPAWPQPRMRGGSPPQEAATAAAVAHVQHMMQHHMNNLQVRGDLG
jgi:hypothetical protein